MKKIIRILETIAQWIVAIFAICFVILIVTYALIYDDSAWCLEHGGVWDGHQKACRYDCESWNKEEGCVPLQTH